MVCFSIKYYRGTLKWLNTYITSFLWSVKMNQRNRLKNETFILWRLLGINRSLRNDAQLNQDVHSFGRSSRYLAIADKILQRVRGHKLQLKNLWIFLQQSTTWLRDFYLIFIAYFILSERNEFSPLMRQYIHKYNRKVLNALFPGDL